MCVVLSLLQVFKVLVRKTPDESWVVFRRYTDFSRLNDKVCCLYVYSCMHVCVESMGSVKSHAYLKLYFVIRPCLQTLFLAINVLLSACFVFQSARHPESLCTVQQSIEKEHTILYVMDKYIHMHSHTHTQVIMLIGQQD